MSDISALEIAVDQPAKMTILDAKTRQPMRSADGEKTAYIEVFSSDSPKAAKMRREVQRKRLNMRGRGRITPEELEAEVLEQLVACTAGWELFTPAGEPIDLEFTPENARKLFKNPKMSWLRSQVEEFYQDISNFG